jgi:hypothetical protein
MSYRDEWLASQRAASPAEAWDSARYCAPDPSLPIEEQLAWYKIFSHCVMLNVSERCRRNAAGQADANLRRRSRLVPR